MAGLIEPVGTFKTRNTELTRNARAPVAAPQIHITCELHSLSTQNGS